MATGVRRKRRRRPAPSGPEELAVWSYGGGDPNQRLGGFVARFFRPVFLVLVGLTLFVVGAKLELSLHLERIGVALLVVGTLWTVAVGFALGTLRLVAAIALLVVVFLLTGVGGEARRQQDVKAFHDMRIDLDIEFNVLRGARTTRAGAAERLLVSAEVGLEGERMREAADDVATVLGRWAADAAADEALQATVRAHAIRVSALRTELEDQLAPTREAVESGLRSLDLEEWSPYLPLDQQPGDVASSDDSVPAPAEAPDAPSTVVPSDERSKEVAPAEARNQLEQAEWRADATRAAVSGLRESFAQLGFADVDGPLTDEALGLAVPTSLEAPPEGPAAVELPDCSIDQSLSSLGFDQVRERAESCVAGCPPSTGVCEPQEAKRTLLSWFQARLVSFTENEDVGEAQDALLARLDEIQVELDAVDEPLAIHQLAMLGADQLLGDLVQALVLPDERPARLGGWGWLVLLLASVIGYRFLEIANDRRSPSPVSVVAGDCSDDVKDQTIAAAALVRSHLGAASLREPSPLPGGEAVTSVAKHAESPGFENELIRYVVSLLQNTAFPRRGIELSVTAQPIHGDLVAFPPPSSADRAARRGKAAGQPVPTAGEASPAPAERPPPEEYRVMIRASTTHRKGIAFSHPFEGETLQDATNKAAYFAAERLLDAGWTTPSWLVWSSQDGTALRAYQEVMIEKSNPQASSETKVGVPRAEDKQQLAAAVAASPGTGAALVALSNEEMLGRHLTSACYHLLLARSRHKRFLTVRYRLGVTLSMMAGQIEEHWCLGGEDGGRCDPAIMGSMRALRTLRGIELRPGERLQDLDVERWRLHLLDQAIDELRFVERSVRVRSVLWRTHRQAEREYWLGLLRSSRRRRALAATARSARALATRRRQQLLLRDDGLRRKERGWSHRIDCDALVRSASKAARDDWLVRYNAACYHAAKAKGYDEHAVSAGKARREINDLGPAAARRLASGHYDEAYDQLRQARSARNGQQLRPYWPDVDPDLQPLRAYLGEQWRARLAAVFAVDAGDLRLGEGRQDVPTPPGHAQARADLDPSIGGIEKPPTRRRAVNRWIDGLLVGPAGRTVASLAARLPGRSVRSSAQAQTGSQRFEPIDRWMAMAVRSSPNDSSAVAAGVAPSSTASAKSASSTP